MLIAHAQCIQNTCVYLCFFVWLVSRMHSLCVAIDSKRTATINMVSWNTLYAFYNCIFFHLFLLIVRVTFAFLMHSFTFFARALTSTCTRSFWKSHMLPKFFSFRFLPSNLNFCLCCMNTWNNEWRKMNRVNSQT